MAFCTDRLEAPNSAISTAQWLQTKGVGGRAKGGHDTGGGGDTGDNVSSVQSQADWFTETGRTSTPCSFASRTSVEEE